MENSGSLFDTRYSKETHWDFNGALILFGGVSNSQNEGDTMTSDLENAFIVQTLQLNYNRPLTRVYPINVSVAITMTGIPQGSLSMGLLWGPGKSLRSFFTTYANRCIADGDRNIVIRPFGKDTCNNSVTMTGRFVVVNPTLEGLGLQVQAGQPGAMPIYSSVTMSFIDLRILD